MKRENLPWVDALRVLACFLVVLAHCTDPHVAHFDSNYSVFLQGCSVGSLVRCSVPLFVMMSGVLLLPYNMSVGEFYRKRVGRVVVPLLFWSVITPLLYFVYINFIYRSGSLSLDLSSYTMATTVNKIYTSLFNFNYDTTPLWYLYMLVGIYLVLPVFNGWLKGATRKDIKLFLQMWGVSLFLPLLNIAAPLLGYKGNYGNMGLFGLCDWNSFGTFHYVSGFIGYIVLAHYLVRYPLNWSWKKMAAISVPMFLVGYAITFGGFLVMQEYFPGNYAYLEIMWLFSGINVFMMTFPVFILFQKTSFGGSAFIHKLATLTFGVYLCHFFLVQVVYDVYTVLIPSVPVMVKMLLMAISAFTLSAVVVGLMQKVPYIRRIVM